MLSPEYLNQNVCKAPVSPYLPADSLSVMPMEGNEAYIQHRTNARLPRDGRNTEEVDTVRFINLRSRGQRLGERLDAAKSRIERAQKRYATLLENFTPADDTYAACMKVD